jgi:hypothetical protein
MATILQKADILKAVQAMTKEDRLKLIAEIATLPDEETSVQAVKKTDAAADFDGEVMRLAHEFMDEYDDLLRRLAE